MKVHEPTMDTDFLIGQNVLKSNMFLHFRLQS